MMLLSRPGHANELVDAIDDARLDAIEAMKSDPFQPVTGVCGVVR